MYHVGFVRFEIVHAKMVETITADVAINVFRTTFFNRLGNKYSFFSTDSLPYFDRATTVWKFRLIKNGSSYRFVGKTS